MHRKLNSVIVIAACALLLDTSTASAQNFREPVIPDVPGTPLTITGDFQQSGNFNSPALNSGPPILNSSQSGFVPQAGGDSLGLVPVSPRNSAQQGIGRGEQEFSGGRTQRDRRLLDQIRSGKFEDAVPGLDIAEDGPKTIRQRYPDGKIQLIRQVIQDDNGNYMNNGPWRLFNPRGEVVARGQFVNGLMDGTWERWHPAGSSGMFTSEPFSKFEGPFISTATFSKGELDGVWIVSDRNTRKILEVPYRAGERHGPATWYFPNSERRRMVTFRNGLLDGPLMEWNEQNRVVRNDEYIEGQKVVRVTAFYAPKQKRSEIYYLEGKLVLEGADSWWDGEPAEYVLDGVRVQHGPVLAWHSNGQRNMAGQFRDDERVGLFLWWHENGTRALSGRYDDGFKNGKWTWWHPNGMKSIEGEYDDDEPVGQWTWWNEDGDVADRDDFGQGRDSVGDLPDPNAQTDEVSGHEDDDDGGVNMGDNPPEGGMPTEREEIRPYPDPFGDNEYSQGGDGAESESGDVAESESGDSSDETRSTDSQDGGLPELLP